MSLPDFQFSGTQPGEAETLGHYFAAGFSILGHPSPVRPKVRKSLGHHFAAGFSILGHPAR
jgi:hypothetical protein